MAEAEKQDRDSEQQGTTDRAEELLERVGHTAGLFGSLIGTRLARIGAFAYEEAEDMWAEAQHMRQHYVSAREVEEPEADESGEPPAEAKADAASPEAEAEEENSEPDESVESEEEEHSGSVEATAKARRQAEELGVNLQEVQGTGKGGRVRASDVKKKAQHES